VWVAGKTVSSLINMCHSERFTGEFSGKGAIQCPTSTSYHHLTEHYIKSKSKFIFKKVEQLCVFREEIYAALLFFDDKFIRNHTAAVLN